MSSVNQPVRTAPSIAQRALAWAGIAWFSVAAFGQAAFIYFILAFYGPRTLSGDFERWNDKDLITGYMAGDTAGNLVFAAHVLLAAVVTLGGLMQLVPPLRRRFPGLHRWTGRAFLSVACFLALSGFWMAIFRGAYLSMISAVAISINGVLILAFAALAWRHAIKRRFDRHRIWAMRTFMVVSGVWFLRVGLMGWIVLNQGPAGLTGDMSGPTDTVFTFGSYLIPLVLLEVYFTAQRSPRSPLKVFTAGLIAVATLFTAAGVFGTVAIMWAPHL
ncbi:DUF2306 domain-containing protein [Brevundimonas sp.]|jgi:hypothetical protein|uniref:DUF2306 domain-containing protein n=1 Tax=Brevundimonas sp. TaxID=1871086 RepID=UPI0037852715